MMLLKLEQACTNFKEHLNVRLLELEHTYSNL